MKEILQHPIDDWYQSLRQLKKKRYYLQLAKWAFFLAGGMALPFLCGKLFERLNLPCIIVSYEIEMIANIIAIIILVTGFCLFQKSRPNF